MCEHRVFSDPDSTESVLREELTAAKAEYEKMVAISRDGAGPGEIAHLRIAALARYSKALREFSDYVLRHSRTSAAHGI